MSSFPLLVSFCPRSVSRLEDSAILALGYWVLPESWMMMILRSALMLVASSKLIIFIHVFFLSVIAVSPFRDATHSESYLRPMSEPLNT